jgi:hypothetical protein
MSGDARHRFSSDAGTSFAPLFVVRIGNKARFARLDLLHRPPVLLQQSDH